MCGYDTTNFLRGQGLEFVKVAVCAILPQQKPLPAALWQQRGAFLFVFFGGLRGVPRARVGAVNMGAQALPRSAFQSNAGAGLEPAPA